MHQDDFARLRAIASNGILAPNVRSLTYFTTAYKSPAVTFQEFKEHHVDVLMQQRSPLSMEWVKPADDLTLRPEYEKYGRMIALQDQIKFDMADLACLKDVLAKFKCLRQVTMSCGNIFYEGWVHEKPSPFITAFPPPTQIQRSGSVRHLEVLLEALAHNEIKVQSLRAGLVDWVFFDKSQTELERLFRPVLDAEQVELEISLDTDDNLHDINGNTSTCRQFMERGVVSGLLGHIERLQILRVGFMRRYKPAMLKDIMSSSHHWPHLKQLELSNVQADRHLLMQVLSLHKDTLRFLCLKNFNLGETSWEKLLPEIRKNVYLEDACICGALTGQVEDMPDSVLPEAWELELPIWENDMRASINCYCKKGGENYPDELPLTDEVVRKHFDQHVRSHVRMTQAEEWEEKCQVGAAVRREWQEAGLMARTDSEDSKDSEPDWYGHDSDDQDDLYDEMEGTNEGLDVDDLDYLDEPYDDEEDVEELRAEMRLQGGSWGSDGSDGDVDE